MSEPTPPKPIPVKTIRVGTEMFEDIIDYVLLVRRKDEKGEDDISVRMSSPQWAHGAMLQEIGYLDHFNNCWEHDEDPEK